MLLNELYKMLDIPEAVQANLAECETKIDFQAVKQDLEQIKIPNPFGWEGALKHLKELLGPDDDGMKILYCQLLCVCDVYGKYIQNGISDQIFIDTMKFFTRFLRDHVITSYSIHYTKLYEQLADNLTRSNQLVIPKCCPVCEQDTVIVQENDVKVLKCKNPA